jgi:transposase-like protein
MSKAADLVEQSVHETLTYYAFPDIHWQKIWTNNPLERIMREIRRRTRVVGAFPDGQSCLNLAAARLRYIAGTASLPATGHANRSRRLIKCAKDSGLPGIAIPLSASQWRASSREEI